MQTVIISLQDRDLDRSTGHDQGQASDSDLNARLHGRLALQACEERQSLALMVAMRDGGDLAPLLVCLRDSGLHQKAVRLGLPVLAIASPANLFSLFKLWRWQRGQPKLLIQTVGRQAIRLGLRLRAMRKPGSTILAHAFFLAAPDMADRANRKAVLAADKIFCGSGHIRTKLLAGQDPAQDPDLAPDDGGQNDRQKVRQIQRHAPKANDGNAGKTGEADKKTGPGIQSPDIASRLEILAPGADLSGLASRPKTEQWQAGKHFVFGMANSLVPRSGALVVVRAMAAIWQFDDLPAWEVRMFGLGPRYHEILDEAIRLGVQSRLCLLAEQTQVEMTCHCHAWLAPGSSTRELPESLWLGPAAGLPLIASKSELHQERVPRQKPHGPKTPDQPNDACRLFAAGDPQDLARAMRVILQDAGRGKLVSSRYLARLAGQAGPEMMAEQAIARYGQWLDETKLLKD